jgi:hypothetical protein
MITAHDLDSTSSGAQTKPGDALEQEPTLFGKLVYLASLRDSGTNHYHCEILEEPGSQARGETLLRLAHREAFGNWLSLSLSAQCAQLQCFLNLRSSQDAGLIRSWCHAERIDALCSPGTSSRERALFTSDLLLALRSLLHDFS